MLKRFLPRAIPGKPWGTELVIAQTDHYLGKILTMKAGHRGGLQYHERKDEAFHLVSGQALVRFDDGTGRRIESRLMLPGETYRVPPGAVHQVEAVTDCVFFEVSTPVFEDRVNVADRYGMGEAGASA